MEEVCKGLRIGSWWSEPVSYIRASVPIRQFSVFPLLYKSALYPVHQCFFLLYIEIFIHTHTMDGNDTQKDEKHNDTVQMCRDPTEMHKCPPPQTNNLTRPATNENLQIETRKPQDNQSAEEPYSIYSRRTKKFLIISVSFMGIISPLSSAVYLPAIPQISHDLNVSPSLVNITITTYMVGFPSSYHVFSIKKKLIALTYRYFKALLHPLLELSLIHTVVDLPMLSAALYI